MILQTDEKGISHVECDDCQRKAEYKAGVLYREGWLITPNLHLCYWCKEKGIKDRNLTYVEMKGYAV